MPTSQTNRSSTSHAGCKKRAPKASCSSRTAIQAPREPMNALAMEENGTWHIYTGNQFNTRTTLIAAAVAGVDAKNILIHQHYLGGGFGRRLESDMVVPAIAAATAVGKPV